MTLTIFSFNNNLIGTTAAHQNPISREFSFCNFFLPSMLIVVMFINISRTEESQASQYTEASPTKCGLVGNKHLVKSVFKTSVFCQYTWENIQHHFNQRNTL